MSDAEIAQAKDIARVLSSAHVGGYNVIANAETLELLEPVVGDPDMVYACLLYTSPSPRDGLLSRMPSSA